MSGKCLHSVQDTLKPHRCGAAVQYWRTIPEKRAPDPV